MPNAFTIRPKRPCRPMHELYHIIGSKIDRPQNIANEGDHAQRLHHTSKTASSATRPLYQNRPRRRNLAFDFWRFPNFSYSDK